MNREKRLRKLYLLYIVSQILFGLCVYGTILYFYFNHSNFPRKQLIYAVFGLVPLFLSSAFVKYMHTLHGITEDSDWFWWHYADIFFVQINGANLELGIVGFTLILIVLGASWTISIPRYVIFCAAYVGVIYISGKLAENTANQMK